MKDIKSVFEDIKRSSVDGFHDGSIFSIKYFFDSRELIIDIEHYIYDDFYKSQFSFKKISLLKINGFGELNNPNFSDEIFSFSCDSSNVFTIITVEGSVVEFKSSELEYHRTKIPEY